MPTSSTTWPIASLTGETWLTPAIRPSVPSTPVMARSTGIPAAASAPKATTRIARVIGTDSFAERPKSSAMLCSAARCALASPACSIRRFGCARCAALVVARVEATRLVAWSELPLSWNSTRSEWPSPERTGVRSPVTARLSARRALTSRAPARISASLACPPRACTSTRSPAGRWNFWPSALSARPDSPVPWLYWSRCFVPVAPPIANARITNASHPTMAVLRCEALQRPARAAMFSLPVIAPPLGLVRAMPRR